MAPPKAAKESALWLIERKKTTINTLCSVIADLHTKKLNIEYNKRDCKMILFMSIQLN